MREGCQKVVTKWLYKYHFSTLIVFVVISIVLIFVSKPTIYLIIFNCSPRASTIQVLILFYLNESRICSSLVYKFLIIISNKHSITQI